MPIFYVGESQKQGNGIFARRDISKGEKILTFEGKLITFDEAVAIPQDTEGHAVQIGDNLYVDLEGSCRFVNHSCNPNSGLNEAVDLFAIRGIRVDEEITFDYSTCMDEDFWTMECNCGITRCRGVIRDFRLLPLETRTRYIQMRIVPEWLLRNLPS